MKVFFVRHGQSEANLKKIYAGQSDVPLTEQGRAEAAAIAPILAPYKFDRVYTSDLSRAIETQEIALPGIKADAASPLIREFDVGSIAGLPTGTAKTLTPEGGRDYTPFGGETTEMVIARLKEFLETYLEKDPCETAAVFTHNGIMIAMMNYILGRKLHSPAIQSKNCAVHVFEYSDGKWKLLSWNYGVKI
jgi:broad specificity phosphatase PhoE